MKAERWAEVRRLAEQALARPAHERPAFLARDCDDDELRGEVEALLAADAADDDRLDTPAVPITPPPPPLPEGTRLGPWEITGEIASGGMGTVYRARRCDGAFERQVALKVVKRGLDTDEVLRRFEHERRVLASLEHEHVAQLLDAGSTDDGRPWLVMEYVEGRPIDAYCNEAALLVRERLALVRAVCAAVDHAHRHLVVHRDLKPGNILVAADGTPKLLDFGIAKLLGPHGSADDSASGATTLGTSQLLTPEYASPEQVRGDPISTSTDVYSLGVVLYEALTGRRPHQLAGLSRAAAERALMETTPPLPSAVAADPAHRTALIGDVDTIVLKALHADPARRYGSAADLADDIDRHLAGLPVRARPDSWSYRASRFIARHRYVVAGAALLFVSLAVGLAVSWTLYAETLVLAESLAAEQARAEARFDDVHALTKTLLAELNAALAPVAGAMAARELIVDTGLDYLQRLAADAAGDDELLADVARGYLTVAELQGGANVANLGRTADARESVAVARARAEELIARSPDHPGFRLVLASALVSDVELAQIAGERSSGEQLERALELIPAPEELTQHRPQAHSVRARVHGVLAQVALARGGFDEAHTHFESAWKDQRALAKLRPDDVDSARFVAQSRTWLGLVDARRGRFDEAETHHRDALALLQPLVEAHPDHRLARRSLGFALSELGALLYFRGRVDECVEALEQALTQAERLSEQSPADLQLQRDVLVRQLKLAPILVSIGRADDALLLTEDAVLLAEQLAAADPDNQRAQRDLGTIGQQHTRALNASGRSAQALVVGSAALDTWRAMAQAAPDDADVRRTTFIMAWDLAMVARSLARAASDDTERRARYEQARDLFQEAHDRMLSLHEEGRLSPQEEPYIARYAADAAQCEQVLRELDAAAAGP